MDIIQDNNETIRQIFLLSESNSQKVDQIHKNDEFDVHSKKSNISQNRHSIIDNLDKQAQDQYYKKKNSYNSYSLTAQIYFAI